VKRRGPVISLVVVLGSLVLVLALNDALIPNQAAAPGPPPTGPAPPVAEPGADAGGQRDDAAESVYVGEDEAGKMTVAVAVKDGQAVGYLCNGRSIDAWLTGTATDGRLALEAPEKDATIYGDITADGAKGIAVVGDYEFDFEIDPAKPPAGLYRKKDDDSTIGWIVLPDGRQVGVASTNGSKKPAPALDPESGEADFVTGETS
jgi:hypothetical protein